ncbi:ion transporter [Herbidospora galbida]|uniref:Ion transporter n=1 Tax=Herbidospora galbida TaxID=2575442 RepID=A0A4U3M9W3_9ACTN|nr:ion channel [Herbidospora galbida]TKK85370.1 ion transporter [Herbidospora galbida]
MPIFLARLLARISTWWTPVLVLAVVFVTSWPLMTLAEPGADITSPGNFWWWFVVTSSTVGYGDLFPRSPAGHLVGVYVIVGGIAALTTLFTRLATRIERTRGRRMHGSITVRLSGHVVLLGYSPGRTETMVDELSADGTKVVVCAWDEVQSHPMPEKDVEFVRGALTDERTLARAGVDRAHSVLVDARDDNEALAVALTADHVITTAHLVVALRDLARVRQVRYVGEKIRCVQWHTPHMITEELRDPGISEIYAQLMTHGGADTYSVPLTVGPVTVEHCQTVLGRHHGATLLAARDGAALLVNPPWQAELNAGTILYYMGSARLDAARLALSLGAPASR